MRKQILALTALVALINQPMDLHQDMRLLRQVFGQLTEVFVICSITNLV